MLGISNLPSTWYCTTCTDAVATVTFVSDYTGITVEFGVAINFLTVNGINTAVFSNTLCVALFDSGTLAAMGQAC
jgi:hypothetical protein